MWIRIPPTEYYRIGDILFVALSHSTNTRKTDYVLRERPFVTNQSHAVRLSGWCGETNNVSIHAMGAARLVIMNRTGGKGLFKKLTPSELSAHMRKLGYAEDEHLPPE